MVQDRNAAALKKLDDGGETEENKVELGSYMRIYRPIDFFHRVAIECEEHHFDEAAASLSAVRRRGNWMRVSTPWRSRTCRGPSSSCGTRLRRSTGKRDSKTQPEGAGHQRLQWVLLREGVTLSRLLHLRSRTFQICWLAWGQRKRPENFNLLPP